MIYELQPSLAVEECMFCLHLLACSCPVWIKKNKLNISCIFLIVSRLENYGSGKLITL